MRVWAILISLTASAIGEEDIVRMNPYGPVTPAVINGVGQGLPGAADEPAADGSGAPAAENDGAALWFEEPADPPLAPNPYGSAPKLASDPYESLVRLAPDPHGAIATLAPNPYDGERAQSTPPPAAVSSQSDAVTHSGAAPQASHRVMLAPLPYALAPSLNLAPLPY